MKTKVTFKTKKVLIEQGDNKALLSLEEYLKLVPKTKNQDKFLEYLKKNIQSYFAEQK